MEEVLFGKGKPYEKTIIFAAAGGRAMSEPSIFDGCETPGSFSHALWKDREYQPSRYEDWDFFDATVMEMIEKAVAAEREECADVVQKLADETRGNLLSSLQLDFASPHNLREAAAMQLEKAVNRIRARENQ